MAVLDGWAAAATVKIGSTFTCAQLQRLNLSQATLLLAAHWASGPSRTLTSPLPLPVLPLPVSPLLDTTIWSEETWPQTGRQGTYP